MSTIPQSTTAPTSLSDSDDRPTKTFFDYPDADIVLRSCDSQEFRVLKIYLIKSSPVLSKRIQEIPEPSCSTISSGAQAPLPIVQLSDSCTILSSLLTFIFPVSSILPPTLEEIMELLSVAQKYEMVSALADIRCYVASKDPPLMCPENAFQAYSLAQKHGLRQEAAEAAKKITLTFRLDIETLEGRSDIPQGDYLYELWKYHQSVQNNLLSNVDNFRGSAAGGTLTGLSCVAKNRWGSPSWLDNYILSIARTPSCFDPIEFQTSLACHVREAILGFANGCPWCTCIPSQTVRAFWTALTNFVNENIAKAETTLSILGLGCGTRPEDQICPPGSVPPLPETLYMSKADLIIQSSDSVKFRVHKSILASSSQFFTDMFSLPQPRSENAKGLPVLQMSEDAELVRALLTILYPIPSEIPASYDAVLSLLVASHKYDMPAVQYSIRCEVDYRKLTAGTGEQAFRAYAIASRHKLTPETNTAAHLTLDYPLTIESIGGNLHQFEGRALRDLSTFRRCLRDDIISCFESFLDARNGPSKIWVDCPVTTVGNAPSKNQEPVLPQWLSTIFTEQIAELKKTFTNPLIQPSTIRKKYFTALRSHTTSLRGGWGSRTDCTFCFAVHARQGEEYCIELEGKLALARDKVFEPGQESDEAA